MNTVKQESACCAPEKSFATDEQNPNGRMPSNLKYLICSIPLLAAWWLVYKSLAPFSKYITYNLLSLSAESHLGSAIEFFLYDTPKVLMLLVLVVFGVGVVRSFFTPERTRKILVGKRESLGNVLAALLGIATPFCTCSAVPLFIGFVTAGIPLGPSLTVNERSWVAKPHDCWITFFRNTKGSATA